MRKLKLYIAITLDGYIATKEGNIDWLLNFPNEDGNDYGYAEFLEEIDVTLMGNQTYKHVLQLADPFPYKEKTNYVFTKSANISIAPYVHFVDGDMVRFVKHLKNKPGKDIWLIGGSQINTVLLAADLIDELHIAQFPIVLGAGIPLFGGVQHLRQFELTHLKKNKNGVLELRYKR
ncbi:dihydrofolate reductase [Chitinophaga dinghuensis]|uniref:Dihydrofolate reductase n=1 Tax=Chitinophaga dinghuensis TaxID=1539050 RepID=A0A327WBQ0_9BACT|nr:dihydrofolate reductase family protein [Chitinophaga dinghuensis]RAJ87945.1 dihydrofolate reductase [Chitinophaga dinghuensis]